MSYLLSGVGRRALRASIVRRTLYAFDFDEFLASRVVEANHVRMDASVRHWLTEITVRLPSAVVSKRPIIDLTEALAGVSARLIGSFGMEGPQATPVSLSWNHGVSQKWFHTLRHEMAESLTQNRIRVENRRYYITLHLPVPLDPQERPLGVVALVQQLIPEPRIVAYPSEVHLLPGDEKRGRGAALLWVMAERGLTELCYFGDAAASDLKAVRPCLSMSVRIGHQEEVPGTYYLKNPGEIDQVLRFLAHRCDGTPEWNEVEVGSEHECPHAEQGG